MSGTYQIWFDEAREWEHLWATCPIAPVKRDLWQGTRGGPMTATELRVLNDMGWARAARPGFYKLDAGDAEG